MTVANLEQIIIQWTIETVQIIITYPMSTASSSTLSIQPAIVSWNDDVLEWFRFARALTHVLVDAANATNAAQHYSRTL